MRWCNTILAGALAIMLLAGWTLAQPPRGRGQQGGAGEARGQRQDPGPPRKPEDRGPGQGRGAGEGRSRNPVILALDMDGDGELSADEIANAAVALRELDRDGDGRLSREEIRPEQGPEGRGETSPAWKPKPAGKPELGDPRKPPRAADQEGAPPAARPRTDDGKEPGAMRKATDARSADAARPGQRPASNQGPQGARPAAAGPVPGFVSIPAGEFEMGDHHGSVDPKHGGDETPIHRVRLDAFALGTYLLDNEGRAVHRWDSQYEPGQSVYLLKNGHLLHCCFTKNKGFTSGGEGGRLEEFDWEGNLVWEFEYSSDHYLSHHDIKPLPNGNILVLAVEKKSYEECLAAGFDPQMLRDQQLFPEHFIEVQPIRPKGGKIVWEWHVWDHLIQDNDASKAGFGKVAEHPELIDVNCNGRPVPAFWNHGNSIAYNAQLDQIILSARGCNEIWVIDHSTTTEEAAGHSGGRSGKGGNLLFRWGNPAAYRRGTADDRQLFQQHDA